MTPPNSQPKYGYKTSHGRTLDVPVVPRTSVSFTVEGRARPQGSKKGWVNPKSGRVVMVEASKGLKPWRDSVKAAAREAMGATERPFEGPVGISLTFVFLRPKSHYGTGRNSAVLKPSAPAWPFTRSVPDLDKLVRGCGDAMTGVVFTDDSQICTDSCRKVWGWPERVEVSVAVLGGGLDYDQDTKVAA